MEPRTTVRRLLRFRLRSLLVVIASLGLLLMVLMQSVWLKRAASREAQLRAELLRERAIARAAVDQFFTQIAESAAAGTRIAEQRRESLKQALKFYQGMESKAAEPEAATRVHERVRQIRSKPGDEADADKL
jgi:hypothetical protein